MNITEREIVHKIMDIFNIDKDSNTISYKYKFLHNQTNSIEIIKMSSIDSFSVNIEYDRPKYKISVRIGLQNGQDRTFENFIESYIEIKRKDLSIEEITKEVYYLIFISKQEGKETKIK